MEALKKTQFRGTALLAVEQRIVMIQKVADPTAAARCARDVWPMTYRSRS